MGESLVRNINKARGVVREDRERDYNSRSNAIRGISKDIKYLGKDMEREQEKAWMEGAAFTYDEAKVCRLASNIKGVSERSEGDEAN